jgi:hypothetical protein
LRANSFADFAALWREIPLNVWMRAIFGGMLAGSIFSFQNTGGFQQIDLLCHKLYDTARSQVVDGRSRAFDL